MEIDKLYCENVIKYNTVGKGKNNPSFTALATAKKWLAVLDHISLVGNVSLNLPEHVDFIDKVWSGYYE